MDVGGLPDDWWSGWDSDLGAPLADRYSWTACSGATSSAGPCS